MRKIYLTLIAFFVATTILNAQSIKRFSIASTVGIGVAINTPSSTPFQWQVLGYYNFNQRLSAGVGTGISAYETTLIPIFADVKFNIIKPRKFTPYLECGAGYSFAPSKKANGGVFVNPSIGVTWAVCSKLKLLLSAGYELQKIERVKNYDNQWFASAFEEHLNHNSISVKIGVLF